MAVDELKEALKGIRTGRANPGMLETIVVEAYGGSTKLKVKELASITTEGADTLVVVPFDPSTTEDINRGILNSDIGFTPKVQGSTMYIKVPALTEEQRQKYSKIVAQKVEETKQIMRDFRNDARKKLKNMEENKEISKDDLFRAEKMIDDTATQVNNQLQQLKDAKQKEIMSV